MSRPEGAAGLTWRQLILLPLLFYAGAKLSLAFAIMPEVLVMLWIPNGIILAALLRTDGRHRFAVAALVIAAEIAADYPTFAFVEACLFGAVNVLEIMIAWLLLRRWDFDPQFRSPADIAKFVVSGPIIAASFASYAGAAIYLGFRTGTTPFTTFYLNWWFSDGLGLLIVTPLALVVWPPRPPPLDEPIRFRWWDGFALVLTLAVVIPFALSHQRLFYGIPIRTFVLIPPVLYWAARLGLRMTTVVVAATAGLVLFVTKNGQQPFGAVPMSESVTSAQELIFIISAMALGLATLLSQHRRNESQLEARVSERTAELTAANERLKQLSVTDSLTGLFNRRALFEMMDREIQREKRHPRGLAVILFDVDHFKDVNDRYGHAAGDDVLRYVSAVTKQVVRGGDLVARFGGEEFVVVASEIDAENALQLAERLRTELRTGVVDTAGAHLAISASFGIAVMLPQETVADEILARADHALYEAKCAGRDRVKLRR